MQRLSDEVMALRQELAAIRDAHASQVQGIQELMHVIRDENVALAQDLHNRQTAQTQGVLDELNVARSTLMLAVRAATDDETGMRRRLAQLRASPGYEAAYTDPNPLVSIVIPTYDNVEGLCTRAIPSALAQTYENIEVIVVGDVSPDATGEGVAAIGDDRVHYENLTLRGPYSDDPKTFWFTAGIYPLNRSFQLARGQWIAVLNDDDAFRPSFVEHLLAHAKATRAEVAYGKLRHHEPDKDAWDLGTFPPTNHAFGWQMALQHAGLRIYEYELHAPVFDEPGDWNRAHRMLRTAVRFSMLDEVVGDYWPSTLWKGRRT